MAVSQIGGMYGREGAYYGGAPARFRNDVWIELIGFDNTKPDFGVEELLERMGFIPDKFLLLSSIDFINLHGGCAEEYELDPFYCSYAGHPNGDEHAIQRWTNLQLKGLVENLHRKGVKVFPGFFDFHIPEHSFFDAHPELYATIWCDGTLSTAGFIYMTKRLADGTYYEDFFLQKAIEVLQDYSFDGIHLPDGVCRPHLPLQNAEYSADMLEQAGIFVPAWENPALYILEHHRKDWLHFCVRRWSAYLEKVIGGIHAAGFQVITNSCWTKDPLEAYYRYGLDYRVLDRLGIDGCVVENGGPTIAIIDTEANAGFRQTYADRQLVHHAFRSSLMCVRAQMRSTSLQPLYPVRDTCEQYDVIHHQPTALPRHSAAIFGSFLWQSDGSLEPVTDGHTYCLGDGLSRDNWRFLRLCADNAYIPQKQEVGGATLIWSDARCLREADALTAQINAGLAYLSVYPEECHVEEIRLDATHTRYIIDNEEFFYTRPMLHTGRPVKTVSVLTHPEGYRPVIEGDRIQLLVPLRGAAILEVEFETP